MMQNGMSSLTGARGYIFWVVPLTYNNVAVSKSTDAAHNLVYDEIRRRREDAILLVSQFAKVSCIRPPRSSVHLDLPFE